MKRILIATRCGLLVVALLLSISAHAQEWIEFYNNTRSLGMGGAGISVSSDETALYRNPANLGSVRNIFGIAFDPEVESTSNFSSDTFSSITGKAFELSSIQKILDEHRDKYYHARLQLTPSMVVRNFGIGLIYRNQMHAEINTLGTEMNTFFQSDMGLVLGANYRFFDGILKVGANVKVINRIEVNAPTLNPLGSFDLATLGSEGTGLSYDVGMMLQAPVKLLPSLGFVIHDIGDTKFDAKDGLRLSTATRPGIVKQSMDIGISIFPIHSNQFRTVWTLEYSDLANSRQDNDSLKRAHFGFETNFRDVLFFRAGMNQRYWTAGFEIASERISWQVASYGEEIGTTVNGIVSPREDRRYNMKITMRF